MIGPRLGERAERYAAVLELRAPEHDRTRVAREPCGLDREPRLAGARLAEHEHHPRAGIDRGREARELVAAASHRRRLGVAEQPAREPAPAARCRRRRIELASQHGLVQRAGRARRLAAQLIAQRIRADGELAQRLVLAPAAGEQAHQLPVRLLAGRLELDDAPQMSERAVVIAGRHRAGGDPQARVDEPVVQRTAPRGEQLGVRIVGTQHPAIQPERPLDDPQVGRRDPLLELGDVDPHRLAEPHDVLVEHRRALADHGAQVVECAVQVVRATLEVLVRPQPMDRLFAMHHVAGSQTHQLEQIRRSASPPCDRGNRLVVALDLEAPEQLDAQYRVHGRSDDTSTAMRCSGLQHLTALRRCEDRDNAHGACARNRVMNMTRMSSAHALEGGRGAAHVGRCGRRRRRA
jgi:hypothetical protein